MNNALNYYLVTGDPNYGIDMSLAPYPNLFVGYDTLCDLLPSHVSTMFKTTSFSNIQLYYLQKLSKLSSEELSKILKPYHEKNIQKAKLTRIKEIIESFVNAVPSNVRSTFNGYNFSEDQLNNLDTISELPDMFIYNLLSTMQKMERTKARTKKRKA